MKILITGGCGFIGSNLSLYLRKKNYDIYTLDNLSRRGSKYNYELLLKNKIKNYKLNIEDTKKILKLPKFDLIIDCCAEPAIEISKKDFDRVINTNLIGTINVLKKSIKDQSKLIFLSSSRVYPINKKDFQKYNNLKNKLTLKKKFSENKNLNGVRSIYGFTKLASEMLIEEFSYTNNLKYVINRCGVVSGPLQFGKQDQGFISLWVWRHMNKKKLSYIGFGGNGYQVRDVLHVDDLCCLIEKQIIKINSINNKIFTVGGSLKSYTNLINLTSICQKITGTKVEILKEKKTSNYDIPYYISDISKVSRIYKWYPKKNVQEIIEDVFKWLNKDKTKIIKYF